MTTIADRLAIMPSPTLADLGGCDIVASEGAAFASDLHADRMVQAIMAEPAHYGELVHVALEVLVHNTIPFVVAAAVQHMAEAPIPPSQIKRAQQILLARTTRRDTHLDAELTSEALAGALLLAQCDGGSRLAVAAALETVSIGDEPVLVRRAAKLAGMAWLWSRSDDVKAILQHLAFSDDGGEQALYELALIDLEDALSQPVAEAMLDRLGHTVDSFSAAAKRDPEMTEAVALEAALRAVMQFCGADDPTTVEASIASACSAAYERALELDHLSLRPWLRTTVAAEVAWVELAKCLQGLSARLAERSWLRAIPVLQQLGKLRSTLLPIADRHGAALHNAIMQRVGSGIAVQEGLRAHILAWQTDAASSPEEKRQAGELLRAIEAARHRTPGNDDGLTASMEVSPPLDLDPTRPLFGGNIASSLTGVPERLFRSIATEIAAHTDVHGEVNDDARILLAHLIHFLVFCLDVTPSMAKGQFDFLFADEPAKPPEIELQRSLWSMLRLQINGFPSHTILREAPDIGAGRADIAIIRPGWRVVIEIKRELSDASRDGIRKYLGQTASYTLTGPRLSFLVVLDLCSQRDWTLALEDNCWVESFSTADDSAPRSVVVLRVPGMRRTPSNVRTPEDLRWVAAPAGAETQ